MASESWLIFLSETCRQAMSSPFLLCSSETKAKCLTSSVRGYCSREKEKPTNNSLTCYNLPSIFISLEGHNLRGRGNCYLRHESEYLVKCLCEGSSGTSWWQDQTLALEIIWVQSPTPSLAYFTSY